MTNPPTSLQRAIVLNLAIVSGIAIGLWNTSFSSNAIGRIAVVLFALMNLLFTVVQPKLVALPASGRLQNVPTIAWREISARPAIACLVAAQFWATGRGLGTAVLMWRSFG